MDREAWNIFSHKDDRDLCCAVPADRPVPPFLFTGNWLYGGDGGLRSGAPGGFNARAAGLGSALNGFHLFMTFLSAGDARIPSDATP